jgi:hypothetical protein
MLFKIGAVLAAIPLTMVAVVAGTGVVVVDVLEGGPSGHHIVVPVPLLVAQSAAAFVPEKGRHLELGEAKEYLPVAEAALEALADSPDGELVSVDDGDNHVRVAKRGGNLEVHVTEAGKGEEVRVTVPLSMASAVLREVGSGEVSPATLVGLLSHARLTTLADVRSDGNHVRVTVW